MSSIGFKRLADLHTIGGLPTLLSLLQDSHACIRWRAAEVVATCVQNNPPVQQVLSCCNAQCCLPKQLLSSCICSVKPGKDSLPAVKPGKDSLPAVNTISAKQEPPRLPCGPAFMCLCSTVCCAHLLSLYAANDQNWSRLERVSHARADFARFELLVDANTPIFCKGTTF